MKLASFTVFALAGGAVASIAGILSRSPPAPGSEAAGILLELVTRGMRSWGLATAVNPPTGNKSGPSRNLPGGLPELSQHGPFRHRPNGGTPGTPGNPLGPRKKEGRIYSRGKVCTKKRGIKCPIGTAATGTTSRYPRIRLKGQGGVMVAFSTLSPIAHEILDTVQSWDNPFSKALKWFNDAMSNLQDAIGGGHVSEIDGNEIKLWLICLLRENDPRYPDAVDKACQRQRDAPAEAQKQQQAIDGLNQVAELCEKSEEDPPEDAFMRERVLELCDKFAKTLDDMIDANAGMILLGEWVRAKTLNDGQIDEPEKTLAKNFIDKGAFGSLMDNVIDASELAAMYLESTSAYNITEVLPDGSKTVVNHNTPPAWMELLEINASYMPEDRQAVNEALQLLESSPYLREFDREGRGMLTPVQKCWTQASLLALQPRRWDRVTAGIVYLNNKQLAANSALACAPCQVEEKYGGHFVLRCGSAVP